VVCYVDVTETLQSGWRAGIQRVVTELVVRLATTDDDLEIVPITWDPLDAAYRRLDRAETERLFSPPPMRNHPPATAATSTLRRIVGPLTRLPGIVDVKQRLRHRAAERRRPPEHRDLVLRRFEPGTVLFDVDATWNVVDADRVHLLDELTAHGVRSVHLVHDVLPCTHPDWFDPNLVRVFNRHVDAHLDHTDLFLANSRHTADELAAHAERSGRAAPDVRVVQFGGDSGVTGGPGEPDAALLAQLDGRRYLLCVGTIEPRKNHAVVLDAYDRLAMQYPDLDLVVVGRQGWRIDDVAERLRTHPLAGTRLHWPSAVDDATLRALYAGALLTLTPSFTEGFGLPVIEALRAGSPVVASDGGALREAGGEVAEYVEATAVDGWVAAIRRHLDDPAHHGAVRARVAAYEPPSWDATADEVAALLVEVGRRR